jgi:hypothetical protein
MPQFGVIIESPIAIPFDKQFNNQLQQCIMSVVL